MAKRRDEMLARRNVLKEIGEENDKTFQRVKSMLITIGDNKVCDGYICSQINATCRIAGTPTPVNQMLECKTLGIGKDHKPLSSANEELEIIKDAILDFLDSLITDKEPAVLEECPHCKQMVTPKIPSRGCQAGLKKCPNCKKIMEDVEAKVREMNPNG